MDVTKNNFKNACKILTDVIKHASFIAIDGEFTGLHNFVTPNAFDTPEERYQKLRQGSMDFLLIQFGVCIFKYDAKHSRYVAYPFNFYVFPKPMLNSAPDQRFLCQSSSMDFLASHGFDFNKVFRDGIPYLTATDREKMRQLICERHEMFKDGCPVASEASPAFVSPAVKKLMEIPNDHKDFINGIIKSVEEFLNNTEKQSFNLEPCTGYRRKLTYQAVKSKFPSGLHLDTQTGDTKCERFIMVRKADENDVEKLQRDRLKSDLDDLEEAAGFASVIQILSESGKVIVGHNMLLDVMHTLHQFSCPLPEQLDEFKSLATCVFPKLADTKVMANTQPFKEMLPSTALSDLCRHLEEKPFTRPTIDMAPNFPDYNNSRTEQYHQAGYDAYVTGKCFATMANYLGTFMTPPMQRVSPTSNLMEPFINKLCLFRLQDIPYVNLAGPDLQPSRAHVFHITFPQEWKADNIYQLFAEFGHVYIGWIDHTSAFVSLSRQDRAETVLKRIEPSLLYKVISYKEYKKQCTADSVPAVPHKQDSVDVLNITNVSSKSDASDNSGNRGLKRQHDSLDSADAEVEEVMGSAERKKQKPMDPNAKPFVSRITPPPHSNETSEIVDSSSPNEPTQKAPDMLFEEATSW